MQPTGRSRHLLFAMAVTAAAFLSGCAGMGLSAPEKPQSFKEADAVTMAIAKEVVNQADILQLAGKIKPADTRKVVADTDEVRDGVLTARRFVTTEPATAAAKVDVALKLIREIRDRLAARGGTFTRDAVLLEQVRRQSAPS